MFSYLFSFKLHRINYIVNFRCIQSPKKRLIMAFVNQFTMFRQLTKNDHYLSLKCL